jgi:hypothetical protein
MAKRPTFNLLDYVKIQSQGETITIGLIVPFRKWPEPLYNKFGPIVRILTSLEADNELLEFPQHVALCQDVRACPKKAGIQENPSCLRYAFGCCYDATYSYNESVIPCRAWGLMQGYSSARIQQMQTEAAARLRRLIMADPPMVEMCHEFGVGGTMPSREEIATDLRRLVGI